MNKILLVEDDAIIASGLTYALEQESCAVTHAATVSKAVAAISAAVIFLTIVDDEGNIVKAFEGGAEDYITKPFRLRELLARVKAVLRRREGAQTTVVTLGCVAVDTSAGRASIGGEPLDLTALEYRLLLTFANNKGQVLSRTQILENLWDSAGSFVEGNTLTVYIKRLREKFGGAANIETVRGLGYRAD